MYQWRRQCRLLPAHPSPSTKTSRDIIDVAQRLLAQWLPAIPLVNGRFLLDVDGIIVMGAMQPNIICNFAVVKAVSRPTNQPANSHTCQPSKAKWKDKLETPANQPTTHNIGWLLQASLQAVPDRVPSLSEIMKGIELLFETKQVRFPVKDTN